MQRIKPIILFWLLCQGSLYIYGQGGSTQKHARDTTAPKFDSLKAVTVTTTMRPRMKGDTMEYNTENVLLRAHAVVEEMLRRLPGLQIDMNGNITYNGEKIQHLLVDGEDIFGSDPTLVTRSFDASKIARVQILDRKSDKALFTGIDDGKRTKTLNLVLKESAKNGYFGKVEAGGNTNGYYNANGVLAAFRDKEQFTALAFAANTGLLQFSGSLGRGGEFTGVTFLNGNTDALGASAGTGIPRFEAAALHYANNWNGTGDHLVANYQYSHYYTQPVTTMETLETQPNSIYGQHQQSQSVNQQDQHWAYGTYDLASKAVSSLRFVFHASNSEGQNQFGVNSSSSFNDTLVNSSQRAIRDKVSRSNVGGDVSWRIRIGRRSERVFSVNVGLTKVNTITNGLLYSVNRFYRSNGTVQSIDTVDQRKQIASHPLNIDGALNYTEPLWKGAVLGMNYGLSYNSDDPLQASFSRGDGKYQEMVDSLSSHFQTENLDQNLTLDLQGTTKRFNYTIGNSWFDLSYRQRDLLADSSLHLHYTNWAPRALLTYAFSSAMRIRFEYSAETQMPPNAQLRPVKNNNDPLHITLGNPALRPGFNQNFRLAFERFRTWMVNLSLNITLTNKIISTKIITDSLGRQISQPVNVDGGHTGGINFSVNRKVFGMFAGFNIKGGYSRSENYVNADLSRNDSYTGSGGISLNKNVADKYSFQLNTNFTYFDQVSSINTAVPVRYWTQSHSGAVSIYLPGNYEVNTSASYTWQQKTSAFSASTSVLLLNGYISRNFLSNKLVVRAQLNNVLNQNSGIGRTNTGNINTETYTNILGCYWMLSATYHFDKKFKQK